MANQNYDMLVVDDQAGVRWLICEALSDKGYMIDQAASGHEALAKLSQNKYRLILLDVKMPGLNGLETLKEIRKLNSNMPVVMMTAYGELDIMGETGKAIGQVKHISKPFDLDDLRSLVQDFLSKNKYDYILQPIHD